MIYVMMGILVCAVIVDFITYKIPNFLVLSGMIVGLVMKAFLEGGVEMFYALIGPVVICVAGFLLYCIHALGAGDIKLIALISVYIGLREATSVLIVSLFIGAILGLVRVFWLKMKKGGNSYYQKTQFNIDAEKYFENKNNRLIHEKCSKMKFHRIHFSLPIFLATILKLGGII